MEVNITFQEVSLIKHSGCYLQKYMPRIAVLNMFIYKLFRGFYKTLNFYPCLLLFVCLCVRL